MHFRPCPSFTGYAATSCGLIKRLEWSSVNAKTGNTRINPETILSFVGRNASYVMIDGRMMSPQPLVKDAWSSAWDGFVHYADYRVRVLRMPD